MFLCIISETKISKFNLWSNGLKTMHPVRYFLVTEMIIETVCLQCELICEETEPGFQYRPWNTLLYQQYISHTLLTHYTVCMIWYFSCTVRYTSCTMQHDFHKVQYIFHTVWYASCTICFLMIWCFPYVFLKYLDHMNFKLFHYLRLS